MIDERARHRLKSAAGRALGDEEATTLMELLPPVGWAGVATKHDLEQLELRFDARLADMGEAIRAELHTSLRNQHQRRVTLMVTLCTTSVALSVGLSVAITRI